MARIKQTARPIDDVVDSGSSDGVSFNFGVSRITSSNLDEFTRAAWFDHDSARPSEGETVPDPHDDEVVVFQKFFLCWFEVSSAPASC
jgi:hypothetical protein